MEIEICTGKDLSDDTIQRMNAQRIEEYGINTKNFRKNEQESIFFFLQEDSQWRAFGMLKPVTITFQDTAYPILGIGNIIAIDKGAGYGKQLMTHIKYYLHDKNVVGLGFCHEQVAGFYRKCGYEVVAELSARFRYRDAAKTGEREKQESTLHVLCYDAEQQFIRLLQSSDNLIDVDVPFW